MPSSRVSRWCGSIRSASCRRPRKARSRCNAAATRAEVVAALAPLEHLPTRLAIAAERDALARAEGGCDVAFGAYCVRRGDAHELLAMHERAGRVRTARASGADPAALGAAVWRTLEAGGEAAR